MRTSFPLCSFGVAFVRSREKSCKYFSVVRTRIETKEKRLKTYRLKFTSGPVAGKTLVVQSTNTGGDLGSNHFDLMIPGGGVGLFDGCTPEFGGIPGAQYGGVSSRAECDQMPEKLKAGCYWRFDWFLNADNPNLTFEQVKCPAALTAISGCVRQDDGSFPAAPSA